MQSDSIFLLKNDGQLIEMGESAYNTEELLQSLIEDHPNLLAGKQINSESPRRWLLISREIAVPSEESGGGGRWSLDHLFLDMVRWPG